MKNPLRFQNPFTLIRYALFAVAWIVVNLLALYPLIKVQFFDIGWVITVGNLVGILLLPFVWLYIRYVYFEKMLHNVETKRTPSLHVPAAIDVPEKKKESIESIAVKTGKKLHIIPIVEIICLQAYGDYVNIMTLQGTYLKEQTLKHFEEHLPEEQFLRVHRSYIVNIHAIKAIERYGREQYLLILSNKEMVKATPEGYRRLRGILNL